MRVVVLQRRLIRGLCALAPGAVVDLVWLRGQWSDLGENWVQRFWANDLGNRSAWIMRIAAASAKDKTTIKRAFDDQIRFASLYNGPGGVRLTELDWKNPAFDAFKKLLKSFYAPYFYNTEGYGDHCSVDGQNLNKDIFIKGFPNAGPFVCPYCDNTARRWELDHFLPKDAFPTLSCHPDNLIPGCHECNSITQKGAVIPLSLNKPDQAADWFHPRFNTGAARIALTFAENRSHDLKMHLIPVKPEDKKRVFKLNQLFGLSKFWGRHVNPDIQEISSVISVLLQDSPKPLSEEIVRQKLLQQADIFRNQTGKWGLAIPQAYLYIFVAQTPALVREILRTCKEDEAL